MSNNNNFWINCTAEQMTKWTCSMDVYETLWINPAKKNLKEFTVDAFAWFTMFIWFVVFAALVYSGFLMILWGADEKQFETWKKGVIYSIIWLLLVGFAYWIVRLVQYIARW